MSDTYLTEEELLQKIYAHIDENTEMMRQSFARKRLYHEAIQHV